MNSLAHIQFKVLIIAERWLNGEITEEEANVMIGNMSKSNVFWWGTILIEHLDDYMLLKEKELKRYLKRRNTNYKNMQDALDRQSGGRY